MSRRERYWHYWTAVGVIPRWQLFTVYSLIAIIGIIGFDRTGTIANRADTNANQVRRLAKENRRLSLAIQAQRAASIYDNCNDQNDRHKTAVRVTLRLLGHPVVQPNPPLTHAQMNAQRRVIIKWVSALVPKRDCQQAVEKATTP